MLFDLKGYAKLNNAGVEIVADNRELSGAINAKLRPLYELTQ